MTIILTTYDGLGSYQVERGPKLPDFRLCRFCHLGSVFDAHDWVEEGRVRYLRHNMVSQPLVM